MQSNGTYHPKTPFGLEEDLVPPQPSQLHHVLGEQKGLFQDRGYLAANAPVVIPDRRIVGQGLAPKHEGWKPCSGLSLLNLPHFWSSAGGRAKF